MTNVPHRQPRLSFTPEEGAGRTLPANWRERTRRINDALHYWIRVPHSFDPGSLRSFLEPAQDSIALVGVSLSSVEREAGLLLARKATVERVSVTVIMMAHEVAPTSDLYRQLLRRLTRDADVDVLLRKVQESTPFFMRLRETARIDLRQCDELPIYGLSIRDHLTERAMMRVYFYTSVTTDRVHPILDITPTSEGSQRVYWAFYEYFDSLKTRWPPRA